MALRQTFKTQIGDVDISARDVVGSLRWENDNLYKYVKVANVTAAVTGIAGDPVTYIAAGVGLAAHTVGTDNSDSDATPIVAGFLTGSVTGSLTVPQYTWLQLTGRVVVPTAVTTGAIGSGVMMSTTLTADKTLVLATTVLNSCGILITASGANNVVLAKCAY